MTISIYGQEESTIFSKELNEWVVEQTTPQTQVISSPDSLEVIAYGGITLWYPNKLTAPVCIEIEACVKQSNYPFTRVSDLNFFWMAQDPKNPQDFFEASNWRNGIFPHYYSLNLYYVGFGGNNNTTTRFRKYDGDYTSFENNKHRPKIIREYTDELNLIEADRWYKIRLIAKDNRVQFFVDDRLLFSLQDEKMLAEGYFGLRTVKSHIKYRNFKISSL